MWPYRVGVRWVWLKGAGGGTGNEYEEVLVAARQCIARSCLEDDKQAETIS